MEGNIVQLLAMLTMLIDHIGVAFFPDQVVWRMIGRLAFPIYAYFIVLGYQRTSHLKNYILRLAIIGMLSQYPFMIALDVQGINAVGSLLVCLLVLIAMDHLKSNVHKGLILLGAGMLLEAGQFDYGIYALLLVCIYRYAKGHWIVGLHALLNVAFIFLWGWLLESFSIISTLGIVYVPMLYVGMEKFRVPRWLWRGFYPAHLSLLALFEFVLHQF
jgi:hypothetical protein